MEDIQLRFYLAGKLNRMRYGDTVVLDGREVQSAWPPTGDHDHSMEGAFRAMALSNGGNRPETSYTTHERITNDLDESFRIEQQFDGDWRISRSLRACPHCHGSGVVKRYPKRAMPDFPLDADINTAVMEKVTIETSPCSHEP